MHHRNPTVQTEMAWERWGRPLRVGRPWLSWGVGDGKGTPVKRLSGSGERRGPVVDPVSATTARPIFSSSVRLHAGWP